MKPYLTANSVREENGQTYWTRIGVAFPTKNGGFILLLNAIPAAEEGHHKIVLQLPKQRETEGAAKSQIRSAR